MIYTYADVAQSIDHALLNPALTTDELEAGCLLARSYGVASVCILPYYLKHCADLLAGSPVLPSTTIGFPHGGQTTALKIAEAQRAIADGALELDMMVNVSQVLSEHWSDVWQDIAAVIQVAHLAGVKVKVIFENCYLRDDHKIRLCEICGDLRADWVKTSTGFGPVGATLPDLQLMRKHSPSHVQVKAAGGIRDLDTLLRMRGAGATRIGTSRTREILDDARQRLGLPAVPCESTSGLALAGY